MTKQSISPSFEEICTRCGSPRIISETWEETRETYGGTSSVLVSQITCSNKQCQEDFDKNRAVEIKKRDELRARREEQEKSRHENMLAKAKLGRTAKKLATE